MSEVRFNIGVYGKSRDMVCCMEKIEKWLKKSEKNGDTALTPEKQSWVCNQYFQ